MASKLDEMIAQLENVQGYKPLTDAEIAGQAQGRYEEVYGQKRQSAQQSHAMGDDALARQLAALQAAYGQSQEKSGENYFGAAGRSNAYVQEHGMQRSNFRAATQGHIARMGEKAGQEIAASRERKERGVASQRELLADQLAAQLEQYGRAQASDTQAYRDELGAREYDRGADTNAQQQQLAMQIYEYRHQLEQEAEENGRWWAKLNAGRSGGQKTSPASKSAGSDFSSFAQRLGKSQTPLQTFNQYQFQKSPTLPRTASKYLKKK